MANNADSSEPVFAAISEADADFHSAYALAASTLPRFISLLEHREEAIFSAKLRFRDPDESERLDEDRFAFIWLTSVHYYPLHSGSGIKLVNITFSSLTRSSIGWFFVRGIYTEASRCECPVLVFLSRSEHLTTSTSEYQSMSHIYRNSTIRR